MPSLSDLEEWIEDVVPQNLIAVTVSVYSEALYSQLTRFGPPIELPSFSQATESISEALNPAPPPPPAASPTFLERLSNYARERRTQLIVAAFVGSGALVWWAPGLLPPSTRRRLGLGAVRDKKGRREVRISNGTRREAVVVLGADTPHGHSLALSLLSAGFVVFATVSSPPSTGVLTSAVPASSADAGYIKPLLLDPTSPTTSLPLFMRSLSAALSLRYPLTSAGDPYASPSESVSVTAVVNCLSLTTSVNPSPLETFSPSHLSELITSHVTAPLAAINALMPVLRSSGRNPRAEPATVISLVEAPSKNTNLPWCAPKTAVANAVAAANESLRREVEAVGRSKGTRTVRVTTLEVGFVATGGGGATTTTTAAAAIGGAESAREEERRVSEVISSWPSFLRSVYGPSFSQGSPMLSRPSIDGAGGEVASRWSSSSWWPSWSLSSAYGKAREPSSASKLHDAVLDVILSSHPRASRSQCVGAGAGTYALAGLLPAALLDVVLKARSALGGRVYPVSLPRFDAEAQAGRLSGAGAGVGAAGASAAAGTTTTTTAHQGQPGSTSVSSLPSSLPSSAYASSAPSTSSKAGSAAEVSPPPSSGSGEEEGEGEGEGEAAASSSTAAGPARGTGGAESLSGSSGVWEAGGRSQGSLMGESWVALDDRRE